MKMAGILLTRGNCNVHFDWTNIKWIDPVPLSKIAYAIFVL